jgi:serine/threonine-protein kinase
LFLDNAATLVAQPFDVDRLEFTGAPRPVAEQVTSTRGGMGFFDVSETGRLTYLIGGELRPHMTPVWVDRNGGASDVESGWSVGGDRFNSSLSLSPEGTRLAISIMGPEATYDLWVKQLDTGSRSQLTFEGSNSGPRWSPNGQSLTFVSDRAGQPDLWSKRADGTGTAQVVLDGARGVTEGFLSPGGWLVYREGDGDFNDGLGGGDIFKKRTEMDSVPIPLVVTEGGQYSAALSPDGRRLAYVSNETGREEVYVRPFEGTGQWLVSTSGGAEPVWAHSGEELFYRNGANELVSVQVSGDPTFVAGQQEVLFSMAGYLRGAGYPMYDVSIDDQRFVMLRIDDEAEANSELILVDNFFEELRQRVGN